MAKPCCKSGGDYIKQGDRGGAGLVEVAVSWCVSREDCLQIQKPARDTSSVCVCDVSGQLGRSRQNPPMVFTELGARKTMHPRTWAEPGSTEEQWSGRFGPVGAAERASR